MKKLIAAATTAGLLIVGTAGIAQAADSPSTSSKAPTEAAAGHGRRGAALRIAAGTIGIEPKALVEAVKGGQTVADVARTHNVDPQTVIDAVVAAADKKVDAAVAAGKLDADRATTLKDKIPQRVTKLANGELKGKRHPARAKLRRHARRSGAVVAAGVIGIQPKALAEALKGGQSVADVARSHNVDPQTVIDAVVTAANKKVDEAVAAGKIKAERATKLKDRLDQRIATLVNKTPRDRSAASS
jgi:transposase-like protein